MQVVVCNNIPLSARDNYCYPYKYIAKANDAQLGCMNILPLWNVKEQVKSDLAIDTAREHKPSIWSRGNDNTLDPSVGRIGRYYSSLGFHQDQNPFWVSAVANGTTTGVLPQHAMRMNSSIICDRMDMTDFPEACGGSLPFTNRFHFNIDLANESTSLLPDFDLRVCVPGNFAASPWSLSRDAQTISQEIFLGMNVNTDEFYEDLMLGGTFGFHCTVNTTRGYFELGNNFNDFTPQPLLGRFPRGQEIEAFNDYDPTSEDVPPLLGPTDEFDWRDDVGTDADAPPSYSFDVNDIESYFEAPGPLAISTVALFGNESYFGEIKRASTINDNATTNAVCLGNRVPFGANDDLNLWVHGNDCDLLEYDDQPTWALVVDLLNWFHAINSTSILPAALGYATFYASDALLTQAATGVDSSKNRLIYASDGRTTQKPSMTLPSMIALSVLLLVEVCILLRVAYYAWKTPTWTATLKSATVAQLANAMDRDTLPPTGRHDEEVLKTFRRLSGRVGVAVRSSGEGKAEIRHVMLGGAEPVLPPYRRRRQKSSVQEPTEGKPQESNDGD